MGGAALFDCPPDLCDGAAVVLTGDFNASADGEVGAAIFGGSGGMSDTFRRVFPKRDADEATFCGWDGTILGERIDWIGVSGELETIDAGIERYAPGGKPASDHYPVTALLRFAER
jgi:endonuclease/exonuclease/phosphatase family metal-dependent hydrolase